MNICRTFLIIAIVLLSSAQSAERYSLHLPGWVPSLDFSSSGKTLAAACSDNAVHLINVQSGNEISALRGHADYVTSVAFSPDGKTVASGS